jgi:energy-coupling factor transporter ATP-binding protein EcfA2
LVNCELQLEGLQLFLGRNGAGKSSVFDVLSQLARLLRGEQSIAELFPATTLTEWMRAAVQTFEMDVQGNGGVYRYRLAIEHDRELQRERVKEEHLAFDGKPLFAFVLQDPMNSTARLYRDDHSEGPPWAFDWRRSGVAALLPGRDNKKLSWFKEFMARLLVVRINPFAINAETTVESQVPRVDVADFASWFRYLSQEQQGRIVALTSTLREVLPRFDSFALQQEGGRTRVLYARFLSPEQPLHVPCSIGVRFDALSHGQQALVVLYCILACAPETTCVCLDEPDNFLALAEVQPLLLAMQDRATSGSLQVLLISHHPEYINYLGASAGILFQRQSCGPTRVRRLAPGDDAPLDLAELMARGWEDVDGTA